MSSFVLLGKNNKFTFISDRMVSAISPSGKIVETNERRDKIFQIDGHTFFCSGNIDLVEHILEYIYEFGICYENLYQEISKIVALQPVVHDDIFSIEFFSIRTNYEKDRFEITQISEYNNFSPVTFYYDFGFSDVILFTGGFLSEYVADKIESIYAENNDANIDFQSIYDKISGEVSGIGSELDILFIESEPYQMHTVVADAIVGRVIAGNTLSIKNDSNNFLLNEAGAFLNNASFEITANDGKSKLDLNAEDGIRIQQNQGGTWRDTFYVDSAGNVRFTGDLTGSSGTFDGTISASTGFIGGWTISNDGLSDSFGNYINSDGDMRIGNLRVSGTTATFDGTIYADKLSGQIDTPQIATSAVTNNLIASGLSAAKVTTGTMSGTRIYGGTIAWPGATMGNSATGFPVIYGTSGVAMDGPGSRMEVGSGYAYMYASTCTIEASGSLRLYGTSLRMDSYTGSTANVLVGPLFSNKRMKFYKGIFWGFDYV